MPRAGLATLVAALLVAGCSSGGSAALYRVRPLPSRPGFGLSGTRVMVLPLSTLRTADAFGCAGPSAGPRELLVDANAQIGRSLAARATHTTWVLPADLARLAANNPGYAPDPYGLEVSQLAPDHWKSGGQMADPLAGQLRSMMSFADARYALVPVELRFVPLEPVRPPRGSAPRPPVECHPILRIAMVDVRVYKVLWAGDLAGGTAAALTPAVFSPLAEGLAGAVAAQ